MLSLATAIAVLTQGNLVGVAAAKGGQVTFKNDTKQLRYVHMMEGPDGSATEPCRDKKTALPMVGLSPEESRSVSFTQGQQLCFALSLFDEPSKPPYFSGVAKGGDTVTVAQPSGRLAESANLMHTKPKAYPWPIGQWPFQSYGIGWDVHRIPPLPDGATTSLVIAIWRDPFTPPHTRTRCTSEAWGHWWPGGPEWRMCNGYATDCQWMERRLVLTVTAKKFGLAGGNLRAAIDECLQTATVAAALAALVATLTVGATAPAAEAAFVAALEACLAQKLVNAAIEIRLTNEGGWTEWVGC
jgi:hypothetical protein